MKRKNFELSLVKVELVNKNEDAFWEFQNQKFKGTMYEYAVKDNNYFQPLKWTFTINVPHKLIKGNYILLKPIRHPQKSYLGDIERKSINFARATKMHYKNYVYAKLNIADVTGTKNKVGIRKGERDNLPEYIRKFNLKLKKTVTSTKGTDFNNLVALIKETNHGQMIRLFFALKIWVLYNKFSIR